MEEHASDLEGESEREAITLPGSWHCDAVVDRAVAAGLPSLFLSSLLLILFLLLILGCVGQQQSQVHHQAPYCGPTEVRSLSFCSSSYDPPFTIWSPKYSLLLQVLMAPHRAAVRPVSSCLSDSLVPYCRSALSGSYDIWVRSNSLHKAFI